ncbi:MAG: alpha/beta hydrolase [Verrucomicrobiaceae bacterium]
MKFRRWLKRGGVLVGVVFLLGAGGLWVVAGRMVSPVRKGLEDYHVEFLEMPGVRGVRVEERWYFDGLVPTLVVRSCGESGPGQRGMILRKELRARGVALGDFGEEVGVLVILHGRNGRKEDMLSVAERYCAAGFVCVCPDLPAHGESPLERVRFGSSGFERGLAGKVADEVVVEFGLEGLPRCLWGMSMGGSFAIHAVAEEPERWEGLVVVSSFDRLEGVVRDELGFLRVVLFEPLEWMVERRGGARLSEVRPGELAGGISVPTLVVHGDADELIGEERGKRLFEAFAGPKKYMSVPGGGHDNVLITEAPVYAETAAWLLRAMGR